MPRRLSLSVLVVSLLTPCLVSAEPYVVRIGRVDAKASFEALLAPYRPLGLLPIGELQNLPGTIMVEMPSSMVGVMEGQGFEVEPFPEHHLLQEGPLVPWHLDRDNQRRLPLDGSTFRPYTGKGVRIFILDTEIFRNPDEFGDRLVEPMDYGHDGKGPFADCGFSGSHATGVASMAAGNVYGVAPGAEISPKRLYDCNGNFWGGPDYYRALDDIATWKKEHPGKPAIVNMSYKAEVWIESEHKLLQVLDRLGVILVAGAGNQNIDACLGAPSGYPETITASASTKEDRKASWAARGTCVDLFAPGENVPIRGGGDTTEWTGSGTSFSSPATAGEIALMLEQIPDLTSAEVRKLVLANATADALRGDLGKGSPNRLLYTGPIREEVTKLTPRWFPSEKRFTIQIGISLNGLPTPLNSAKLYRGKAVDGHCQGAPFANVTLSNGSGTATVKGWRQAPAYICVETRAKTVTDRAVKTL